MMSIKPFLVLRATMMTQTNAANLSKKLVGIKMYNVVRHKHRETHKLFARERNVRIILKLVVSMLIPLVEINLWFVVLAITLLTITQHHVVPQDV